MFVDLVQYLLYWFGRAVATPVTASMEAMREVECIVDEVLVVDMRSMILGFGGDV